MQLTLKNIRTQLCPKCNFALIMFSLDGDTLWYWCPHCVKDIYEFTVCSRCSKVYLKDGYNYCSKCREIAYQVIDGLGGKSQRIL
jgi:Zn-finger nucleic acid-binding protein